ncbi:MAG TPA: hypothetical protein VFS58_14360 [Steroidobacteraceae bacterium]|nr:hypothetical protein [Steroidobacteraceae bacterium]
MSSSIKSFAIGATLLLLGSVGVPVQASTTDTDSGAVPVCSTGSQTLFRPMGHPGKSILIPQRKVAVARRCSIESRDALMLASFMDAPGGGALMAGRPQRAIEQLGAKGKTNLSAAGLTNLCVAHTVARDWTQALDACDAALAAALDDRSRMRSRPGTHFQRASKGLAVAYSNRAVMRWLSHDTTASADDLSRARAIAPKANFVVRNTELTARVPAQAQVRLESAPIG